MTYDQIESKSLDISYELSRWGFSLGHIPFILSYSDYRETILELLNNTHIPLKDCIITEYTFIAELVNGIKFILLADIPSNSSPVFIKEALQNVPRKNLLISYRQQDYSVRP